MSQSADSFQSPYWKPVFSQEILLPEDQLKTYVTPPDQAYPMKQKSARIGMIDAIDLNYFDPKSEALKPYKQRFPFFY